MLIAIVGAGMMGADIAQAAALGDNDIILHDTNERTLRLALARASRGIDASIGEGTLTPLAGRRAKRRFRLTTRLDHCAEAALVIEAIPEDLDQKRTLLRSLEGIVGPETILASSTNTLPITLLAAGIRLPERVVGLHFFAPANTMRLVEVIRCPQTRADIVDRAQELVRHIGKTPVVVDDRPGWIVNRVALAYFGEALHLLDNHLDVATIDRLMEAAGLGMGPFRLMDYLGVDRVFDMTRTVFEATYHAARYRPHPRQQQLIEAGHLGRRTGRGFYPPSS
jgi:3-hydroxybutyryl-CoA dehydrogenase